MTYIVSKGKGANSKLLSACEWWSQGRTKEARVGRARPLGGNSMAFFGMINAPKIEMKIGTRYHFGKDISMNRQFIPLSGYFCAF